MPSSSLSFSLSHLWKCMYTLYACVGGVRRWASAVLDTCGLAKLSLAFSTDYYTFILFHCLVLLLTPYYYYYPKLPSSAFILRSHTSSNSQFAHNPSTQQSSSGRVPKPSNQSIVTWAVIHAILLMGLLIFGGKWLFYPMLEVYYLPRFPPEGVVIGLNWLLAGVALLPLSLGFLKISFLSRLNVIFIIISIIFILIQPPIYSLTSFLPTSLSPSALDSSAAHTLSLASSSASAVNSWLLFGLATLLLLLLATASVLPLPRLATTLTLATGSALYLVNSFLPAGVSNSPLSLYALFIVLTNLAALVGVGVFSPIPPFSSRMTMSCYVLFIICAVFGSDLVFSSSLSPAASGSPASPTRRGGSDPQLIISSLLIVSVAVYNLLISFICKIMITNKFDKIRMNSNLNNLTNHRGDVSLSPSLCLYRCLLSLSLYIYILV